MTTPTYIPFNDGHPVAGDDGTDVPAYTLGNLAALADDMGVIGMLAVDQTITYSGGKLQTFESSRNAILIKGTVSYSVSGPSIGKPSKITWTWSNDNGATYAPRTDVVNMVAHGELTFSYDGSGNLTGATWS